MNALISRLSRLVFGPTVSDRIDHHLILAAQQYEIGDISRHTLITRQSVLRHLDTRIGHKRFRRLTVPEVVQCINGIADGGIANTAHTARRYLIRLYREAQEEGIVPAGFCPPAAARPPKAPVLRARLSLAQWQELASVARDGPHPYLYRAMLLALVTGQRRGDIIRMQYTDIWDNLLHVRQEKTGAMLAIPLDLKLYAIGWSLREVVDLCRQDGGLYLIHPLHTAARGASKSLISRRFSDLYREVCGPWAGPGTPPSFHEQRSLSERLYRDEGIDTRRLLGHRKQDMTDMYNHRRGLAEWVKIPLKRRGSDDGGKAFGLAETMGGRCRGEDDDA